MFFINKRLKFCYLIVIILLIKLINANVYQQSKCEFRSKNFSLEWAFEPLSKNVVFVLKAEIPQNPIQTINETKENKKENKKEFSTGIGFQKSNVCSKYFNINYHFRIH